MSIFENEILRKSITNNSSALSDIDHHWIDDFKLAMSRATSRKQKLLLLTTIPVKWPIRKISKEFGVSRHMVRSATKLLNEKGYCMEPDKKGGKAMSLDLINEVKEFYLNDNFSRVLPGVKDFKSVKINGKRTHETVSRS